MASGFQALQEQNSAEVVARRIAGLADPVLADAIAKVVRSLHQAVREVRPSVAQWRAAIDFLTEVGHASDERRQEWVLLSDLLGVTQLVEEINTRRPKDATPNTAKGPFYRPDAPRLPLGANISLDGAGESMVVTGHVRDLDGKPVAGAVVEAWQANAQGWYENQQPDMQPEFNLRGRFSADENGDFAYRTVRPAGYRVPDDGPVLSDVLGVSMLVDAINNRKPSGASESTVLGPFHVADAPELPMGANICLDRKGEDMVISGRILDTEGRPIADAVIDVWQANDEGFYDVQPDFNLRGVFRTGPDGRYWFRAVKPKYYPIPDDGTVGKLLNALGRHPYRPAHLHYIIKAVGYETLTTHIFDPDDPYINSDAVFGVKESLLAEFGRVDDAKRAKELEFSGWFWEVEHDFVLASA